MSTSPAPALKAWFTKHRAAMIRTLEALVRAESPTSDFAAQKQVFTILRAVLEDSDHRTLGIPRRGSGGVLYAVPRKRPRPRRGQLIVAHTDTVWPHGTIDSMPYKRRPDGTIWGPGAYDTKAGLVQAVFAMRALYELGLEPPLVPVLLVNSDEETGSPDSTRLVQRVARCADRAWVLEPSLGPTGKLKTARKGVGHFTVIAHGRAAHAGLDPEHGVSAIVELAHVIHALHALNDPEAGTTVNIGEISGGSRRNVIPAQASAEIDARTWTHEAAAKVEAEIRALPSTLPGARIEIRGDFVKQPMERTDASMALWERARDAAEQLGIPLDHGAAGGASDGNTIAEICPVLDGLGAVGAGAHARHEHVFASSIPERASLLAMLLLSPA